MDPGEDSLFLPRTGSCEVKLSTFQIWISVMCWSEKAMAPHSSTLAWKIPWMEEPGGLQSMGSLRVRHNWATSLSLFHFHALEKEMATHSSVLAWRIPGTGEPGGLPSMGSHRVGLDWSDLAAAAAWPRWTENSFLLGSLSCLSFTSLQRDDEWCVSFSRTAVTKYLKLGDLNNRHCSFVVLEPRNLKSRCRQGCAPSKASGWGSSLPLPASGPSGITWLVAAELRLLPPPSYLLPLCFYGQISLVLYGYLW